MFKKFLSLLLAVMMVVSVMAVGVVTSTAATSEGFKPESTKIYFDVDGTGWTMGAKDKIAFYMVGGDFDTEANPTKPLAWGASKLIGTATANESGIFEIDPVAKLGYQFTPGVQYKIIFAQIIAPRNWGAQTCSLFFTTDCFGHVAYSDGTEMENDVDSTKKSKTVYWRDIDPEENGPVLAITSIGNVVGSCVEQGKTKYTLLQEFFAEEKKDFNGKTGYQNAHSYKCEIDPSSPGYKTEQKLIDDIGAGLGLSKDEVKAVLEEEDVVAKLKDLACSWSYDDSVLPAGVAPHTHTPGEPVQENVVPASCSQEGSYDEVIYCTECQEEISREQKTIDKLAHTPGEPAQENVTVTHDKTTYDEVVYCTECQAEISRTPVELPIITHTLTFVPEVPASAIKDGVKAHYACENCDKLFADADGTEEVTAESLVIPAEFVRGDVNKDGVFDATDVTVLQRKLVEYEVETYNEVAADVDGDGTVDVIDVTLMQRVLANITTWEAWDAKHPA